MNLKFYFYTYKYRIMQPLNVSKIINNTNVNRSKGYVVVFEDNNIAVDSGKIKLVLFEHLGYNPEVHSLSESEDLSDEIEPYLGSNVYKLRGFDENGDPYDPFSYDHHESKK